MDVETVIRAGINTGNWAAKSSLENLQWYNEYTEGYDSGKGIIVANWNDTGDDDTMKRVGDILERLGYVLDWEDTTAGCDHCYRCICTQLQYMADYPHYHVFDGWIVCESCIEQGNDTERYLADIAERQHRDYFDLDLDSWGYKLLWETGRWYGRDSHIIGKLSEALRCSPGDLVIGDNGRVWGKRSAIVGAARIGANGIWWSVAAECSGHA